MVEATDIPKTLARDPWSDNNPDGVELVAAIAQMVGMAFFQDCEGGVPQVEILARVGNLCHGEGF